MQGRVSVRTVHRNAAVAAAMLGTLACVLLAGHASAANRCVGATDGCDSTHGSVQAAVDAADPGDAVVVGGGLSPWPGTVRIDRNAEGALLDGLKLCSVPPGGPPPLPDEPCDTFDQNAVLDGQGTAFAIVDVRAPNVLVQGFTFKGLRVSALSAAVRVGAPGAVIADNVMAGDASLLNTTLAGAVLDLFPAEQQYGVFVAAGADDFTIERNAIDFWDHSGIYVHHDAGGGVVRDNQLRGNQRAGVRVAGQEPVTIEDNAIGPNTLRGVWLEGSVASIVRDNTIDLSVPFTLDTRSGAGVLADGTTDALIGGNNFIRNTFRANLLTAVSLDRSVPYPPPDVVLRRNAIRIGDANVFGLAISNHVNNVSVDARLNDWGVYNTRLVQLRILDLGEGNTVQFAPFLDAGFPVPPLPLISGPASHSSTKAGCEGHPDADWDPDAGRCIFLTDQAALDFAHAGSTVLIPYSSQADPTPRPDAGIVIDTNSEGEALDGLTLCTTTLRSTHCVLDAEAGNWVPLRSEWAPGPGPGATGMALRHTTVSEPTGLASIGGASTSVAPGLQLDDIGILEFDVYFEGSGCVGGSPRFQLGIDKDGDGDVDGTVHAYAEYPPNPCAAGMNVWQHHDLTDAAARWDATQLVGAPFVRTRAAAHADLAAAFPGYTIRSLQVVWDSGWAMPAGSVQATWFDNVRFNNIVLVEPQQHACGVADLAATCPQGIVARGVVFDGQAIAGHVVDVRASGVLVHGLTVRNPGSPSLSSAVRLAGQGQSLRNSLLPGDQAAEAVTGSPALKAVGVHVCCVASEVPPSPASDYLIEGNEISGWRTAGVYVAAAVGPGGEVRGNHFLLNPRSGVFVDEAPADAALRIEDNLFGPSILRGIELRRSDGVRIEDNRFDLSVPLTLDPKSGTGIYVDGSRMTFVGGNTFEANAFRLHPMSAVTLDGGGGFPQPDVLFRRNQWRLGDADVVGLRLTDKVNGLTVDARLEDWGVYNWRLLPLRVADEGAGNLVQQIPFLLADGTPEPPLPTVSPSSHCSAAGFAPLSIQEALWCAHPATPGLADSWVAIHPSASSADPTPYLENVVVDANRTLPSLDALGRPLWGAADEALDGLILCSDSDDPPGCDFDAARTVLDGRAGSGPAVTLAADDVSFSGFTVRGSSPLLLADGATWTFGATPLVNGIKANTFRVVQDAGADRDGLVLRGTSGAFLTGNVVHGNAYPGSIGVDVVGGDGAEIAHTSIFGSSVGIRYFESADGLARSNAVVLPPRSELGGTTYGLSLVRGSGHTSDGNTFEGPGWGIRVDGTDGVRSDGDRFQDVDAGIELTRTGAVQPHGLVVRDADFKVQALALHIDPSVAGVVADLRLNTWGTDEWRVIQRRFDDDGAGNTVKFLPYKSLDGSIEPPPPTVLPSNHCDAAGFEPWNLADAVGCAHAHGVLVLRPSARADDPTPYLEPLVIEANSEGETLQGLTVCSAPTGVDDCSQPQAQATLLQGDGRSPALTVRVPGVTVRGLTFGAPTTLAAERAVDASLNHWGVYRLSEVKARLSGASAAHSIVVPFLDTDARTPILPPTASFAPDRTVTDRLTAVAFADASAPGTKPLQRFDWDFADGATAEGAGAVHTFPALGDFAVRLTITDAAELTSTAERVVRVVNIEPRAAFAPDMEPANRVDPVRFLDASVDLDGTIAAWAWDFGEGAVSTAQEPQYTFPRLGTFTVRLTVTDNDGDAASYERAIEVVNLAPGASFRRDEETPMLLKPVQFTDASVDRDGAVVRWAWDFGDGFTSTERNPLHAYLQGGWHDVVLTVLDSDGASTSSAARLYVCAPGTDAGALVELGHLRLEFEACLRVTGDDPL